VTKKTTSQNAQRWEFFDLGLCFDGPNLMVFELIGLFQQSRTLSMVLKIPTQFVASGTLSLIIGVQIAR
jgi:hypothetical protein